MLCHAGPGDRAGDVDLDVRGQKRGRYILAGLGRVQQQGAAFHIRQTNKARAVGTGLMLSKTDEYKEGNADDEENLTKGLEPALPWPGRCGAARCVIHDDVPAMC